MFFCPLFASNAATLAFVGPELDFETLDEGEDEVEVEGLDEPDLELVLESEPIPKVQFIFL